MWQGLILSAYLCALVHEFDLTDCNFYEMMAQKYHTHEKKGWFDEIHYSLM